METLDQNIIWDYKRNEGTLYTKFNDGSILAEPVNAEEAAQWNAEHRY